jgi:hypothetical protein
MILSDSDLDTDVLSASHSSLCALSVQATFLVIINH